MIARLVFANIVLWAFILGFWLGSHLYGGTAGGP